MTATGRVVASALVGAIIGYVGYLTVAMAAFIQFADIVSNADLMGGVGEAIPGVGVLIALVVWGMATGAYIGWRLAMRRRTNEPPT